MADNLAVSPARDNARRVPFPPQPDRTDRVTSLVGDYAPDPRFRHLGEMPAGFARRVVSPIPRTATVEEWAGVIVPLILEAGRGEYAQPTRGQLLTWIRRSWIGPRGERHRTYDGRWNHSPEMQAYRARKLGTRRRAVSRERYRVVVGLIQRGLTVAGIVAARTGEAGFGRANVYRMARIYRRHLAERVAALAVRVQRACSEDPAAGRPPRAAREPSGHKNQARWTPVLDRLYGPVWEAT